MSSHRNLTALALLEILNDEYLGHQHGCVEAEVMTDDNDEPVFNKKGEAMFMDCDGEKFSATEMFEWYNIVMHDPENAEDITLKMRVWHGKAIEAGYITEETKKEW